MMSYIVSHLVSFAAGVLIGLKTHDNIDISAGKVELLNGSVENVEVKITEEPKEPKEEPKEEPKQKD